MAMTRLTLQHTALLVIDVQENLAPHIHNVDRLLPRIGRLIDGANAIGLPMLVTEQYRKGLGATVPQIDQRLATAVGRYEKLKFSACIEPVRDELAARSVRAVIVCGIEAHVCVLQTCLELADCGFIPAVALDCIGSRHEADQDAAVQRMIQAGVVPTTAESALLELLHEAGGERFKKVLQIIK